MSVFDTTSSLRLRVNNIRLPVEADEADLVRELAKRLHIDTDDVVRWKILRKSLDARQRNRLQFVYSAVVDLPEALPGAVAGGDMQVYTAPVFDDPEDGHRPLEHRPVVIGTGPAGLLAGYYLAQRGYRPLLLERGQPVKERVPAIRSFDRGGEFENENNYLFGEGGAGCFSDGKLTCRVSGPDVDWVLERFVECGGRESLVYEHRPHLGSNKLPMICRNFRRRIEAMGGEYQFGCCVEGIETRDGRVTGLATSSGHIAATHVVLAIGHSARDTYSMLHAKSIPIEQKAFQLGLRIEHPQENVNRHKYGRNRYLDLLGAADYSLVAKGQRDLYTFCMCAGGIVIPSVSEPGMFCSNGMSNSRHNTPFANSGLVVTLEPDQFGGRHPLAGVELQRRYERLAFELAGRDYLAPMQSANDFLQDREPKSVAPSSYERGTRPLNLRQLLPDVITNAIAAGLPIMDRKWKGSFLKDANLFGPEMRGSAPVRIPRDRATFECPGFAGLYPVGEGAGYAGGIVTAAIDGLRGAREIVRRNAPVGS